MTIRRDSLRLRRVMLALVKAIVTVAGVAVLVVSLIVATSHLFPGRRPIFSGERGGRGPISIWGPRVPFHDKARRRIWIDGDSNVIMLIDAPRKMNHREAIEFGVAFNDNAVAVYDYNATPERMATIGLAEDSYIYVTPDMVVERRVLRARAASDLKEHVSGTCTDCDWTSIIPNVLK